jgi:hypothetical protein
MIRMGMIPTGPLVFGVSGWGGSTTGSIPDFERFMIVLLVAASVLLLVK